MLQNLFIAWRRTADSDRVRLGAARGVVHVPNRGVNRAQGDDIAVPWHYTTIVDFIDHWQTLLAGLIALIAAIITVFVTLKVERRKVDREVDALRKSLAIELRQLIPRALGAHASLQKLGSIADGPITARMVESLSRMPVPIVYPANAHKIGLLEGDAMDVVIIYGLLEIARDGVARLMTYRTPDDITPSVVLKTAEAFLEACKYARSVLQEFRTGVASHDDRDEELLRRISAATCVQLTSEQYPSAPATQK
jgi:hypothetical protein